MKGGKKKITVNCYLKLKLSSKILYSFARYAANSAKGFRRLPDKPYELLIISFF